MSLLSFFSSEIAEQIYGQLPVKDILHLSLTSAEFRL